MRKYLKKYPAQSPDAQYDRKNQNLQLRERLATG